MESTTGRQDAYRARTRQALLKSAQIVLGQVGLSATIEDLAKEAQVSPATIYNHFESKDEYLKEALNDIWVEWVAWAYDGRKPGENLETSLDVCRKLFRVDRTNTLLGRVLANSSTDSSFVFAAVRASGGASISKAALNSGLEVKDFDMRLDIWAHSLIGIFQALFVTQKLTPAEADKALRISLSLLGLNETQAEAITSKPINL